MSDAVVTLLAGLGGALIGAFAALGAQALSSKHTRDEDRRREQVDLVARLWDSADRLWRTTESLDYTVTTLMNAESSKNVEVVRIYEDRRVEQISQQHTAETESRFLIAQMRLLYPQIADAAQALCDSSLTFNFNEREALRARRQSALVAYEDAAHAILRIR